MHKICRYVFVAVFVVGLSLPVLAAETPTMTTAELKAKMGAADLVILDVRGRWDWNKSDQQISGSLRVEPGAVQTWASDYPGEKTIVLYCA